MSPRQQERVAGVIVRPPCLVFVGRATRSKSLGSAGRRLLVGNGPSRHGVDQHVESSLSDPTEEVEVLETEEPLRIGDDAGVEDRARDSSVAPQLATSTGTSSYGFPGGGTRLTVWDPRPTNRRP